MMISVTAIPIHILRFRIVNLPRILHFCACYFLCSTVELQQLHRRLGRLERSEA